MTETPVKKVDPFSATGGAIVFWVETLTSVDDLRWSAPMAILWNIKTYPWLEYCPDTHVNSGIHLYSIEWP